MSGSKSKGKGSKNNVENRNKQVQYKIHDSVFCEKCSEHSNCKEYNDYIKCMEIKHIGFGIVCKHGK